MAEVRPRVRAKEKPTRVSSVDKLISELDGTYYKLSEAAQILDVAPITLRRLLKKEGITAPSFELQMGNIYVYLYTPADLKELKALLTFVPERRR